MLISCEKCSTTYVLDSKLIPPGGAPVQCTRCNNVFLAKAEAPPATIDAGGVEVLVESSDQAIVASRPAAPAPRASARNEPPRPKFTGQDSAPASAQGGSWERGGTSLFGVPAQVAIAPAPARAPPAEGASRVTTRPYSSVEAERLLSRFAETLPQDASGASPVPARHARTQLFALSDIQAAAPAPAPATAPSTGVLVEAPALRDDSGAGQSAATRRYSMSEFGTPAPAGKPAAAQPPARPAFQTDDDPELDEAAKPPSRQAKTQLFALADLEREIAANASTPPSGSTATEPPPAAAPAPRTGTVLFALSDLERPPASASAAPAAPAAAASGPTPPARMTQVFGLEPVAPQAAVPASPEPKSSPPLPPLPSAPPIAAKPVLQVLGPNGFEPAPPPPRTATQTFGAVQASPAAEQGSRGTMVFGAVPAPPAAPLAPEPSPRSTMVFGAAPVSPAPEPGPRSTMVFGATPPGPGPVPTGMPFGTPSAPEQAPQSTMVFGAPPASAPQANPRSTMVFGGPPAPASPVPRGTMVFGAPAIASPSAPPPQAGDPFLAPERPHTPHFGAPLPSPAAPTAPSPFAGPAPADQAPRMTQLFGLEPGAGAAPGSAPAAPVGSSTLIFGGAKPAAAAAAGTPPASAARPAAVTPAMPGRGFPDAPTRAGGSGLFPVQAELAGDDPEAAFRAQLRRRNRLALIFIALVLLGAGGFAGYKAFGRRRPALPAAVANERDAAFALVRKDDVASLTEAARRLTELAEKNPQFVEPRAAQLIALSLQLDDARLEVRKLHNQAEELNKKINRLKEARSPADWEGRVSAMAEQVGAIKKISDPLVDRAEALESEVMKSYRALGQHPAGELTDAEQLSVTRAQAIYFGIKGGDQVNKLAERYQALLKGADDGWGAVALAEFAANARVAPETVNRARDSMEALRAKDSTFFRPYVLSARLAALAKNSEGASGPLESLVLLHPKHELAAKLLGWVRQEPEAAEKLPKP